ncbi:hypothetical protein [Vibrio sp. 10N.261.51.F12]
MNDDEDTYRAGRYLTIQRYVDKEREWQHPLIDYQEKVIGRSKFDDE